jgi:hypothetical protein
MKKLSGSAAAALAMLAMAGLGSSTVRGTERASPSRTGQRNAISKAMLGSGGGYWRPKRNKRGPGWTHAHVQRMKTQRRNHQRNKAAHRG